MFRGHGVGAKCAPGMAAEEAFGGEPDSNEEAVDAEGFEGVGGAGGLEAAAAGRAEEREFDGG